jgi:hypothetical protein
MRRGLALLALFALLAVLHTWPLASDPAGLGRLDNDDTGLNVWAIAWVQHVLPRAPLQLFEAPIFHPEPHTLAYSEHMLVPALMGAPLRAAGVGPVAVYNLLVLIGFALSGWTMCLVAARWTGSTTAGMVAGTLFAFNAHLLTRIPHLQALHLEFFPIALWAFDRVLTAPPDRTRGAAAVLVAAFVLQALCSNYTLVFVSGALLMAAAIRGNEWLGPDRWSRAAWLVASGVVAVLLLAPVLWPYYVVSRDQGLVRSIDEVRLYSAGWQDYLVTGGRLHYGLWSHRFFEDRTALFPGVTALALAVFAVTQREVRRDPRARMLLAVGVAGLALSFGPALPGYTWLHAHVPLLQGVRAAARWGLLPLTAVAVLAAYAVALLERRWRRSPYWPAAALALLSLLTFEALRAPMGLTPVTPVPPLYARLTTAPGAVVEWPLFAGRSVSENARYLVHATRHFRPLVNGYSGFEPAAYRQRAERWQPFPALSVLDEMRALGVSHVVVHLADTDARVQADVMAEPRLTLIEDDGERRLYALAR